MLKIFTDTDTDITPAIAKEYNIDLISMPYVINGELIYPYKEYEVFNAKEYYDVLRGGVVPTTCALSIGDYINYFEPIFKNGDDILYIHFSAAMSVTFSIMHEALKELQEKYPERKFYEIDTKLITIGSFLAVREICEKYQQEKDVLKLLDWANEKVSHYATYFFADDLKFFKHSGRVKGIAATMGTIIGIKPIIHIDSDGVMKNIGKVKGRSSALSYLVSKVEELGEDIKNHRIIIGHTDCLQMVEQVKEKLFEKFGNDLNIEVVDVNPTAGGHCGPNCVGIAFYAKSR